MDASKIPLAIFVLLSLVGLSLAGSFSLRLRDELAGFPKPGDEPPTGNETPSEPSPNSTDGIPPTENNEVPDEEFREEATNEVTDDESSEEVTDLNAELEGYHCDPLESLIEELVNATALDFYFDMMYDYGVKYGIENKEEFFALVNDMSGYDLMSHVGRHKLACSLYAVKDLEGLTAMLGLPLEMTEMVYRLAMDGFENFGGMEMINIYSKVIYEFSTWSIDTGYPEMPLKEVTEEDVRDNMKEWQTAIFNLDLEKGTNFMELLDATILPIKIMPEYTAKVLTTSRTTEDMIHKLCIDEKAYILYTMYSTPSHIQSMLDLMVTAVRIMNEMANMGLFSLTA